MKIDVQWTTDPAAGWVTLDILKDGDWRSLDSKPEPVGGEVIDTSLGWVHRVSCQGVSIQSMDHYHVSPDGGAIVITAWNDDPVDWPVGTRWAQVWRFELPTFDGRIGRINTRQWLTVYEEAPAYTQMSGDINTEAGPVLREPWTAFVVPGPGNMVRHGIWTDDALNDAHFAIGDPPTGWRGVLVP